MLHRNIVHVIVLSISCVCGSRSAAAGPATTCDHFAAQLELDKKALARQQKSIAQTVRTLNEWEQANTRAQRDALLVGLTTLGGGLTSFADDLESMARRTRTFDEFLKRRNVPLYLLSNADARPKVLQAYEAFVKATAAARGARFLRAAEQGMAANDIWDLTKAEIAMTTRLHGQGDTVLRHALDDPQLRDYLTADETWAVMVSEFAKSLTELGAESQRFAKRLGPAVELASFVVDYGYNASQWTQSRRGILQSAKATEAQLQAVNRLSGQISKTTDALKKCRENSQTVGGVGAPLVRRTQIGLVSSTPELGKNETAPTAGMATLNEAARGRNEAIVCRETIPGRSCASGSRPIPAMDVSCLAQANREVSFRRFAGTWIAKSAYGGTYLVQVLDGRPPQIRFSALQGSERDGVSFDNVPTSDEIALGAATGQPVAAWSAFAADQKNPRYEYGVCDKQVFYRSYFSVPPPTLDSAFIRSMLFEINFTTISSPKMVVQYVFWGPNEYEGGVTEVKREFDLSAKAQKK